MTKEAQTRSSYHEQRMEKQNFINEYFSYAFTILEKERVYAAQLSSYFNEMCGWHQIKIVIKVCCLCTSFS